MTASAAWYCRFVRAPHGASTCCRSTQTMRLVGRIEQEQQGAERAPDVRVRVPLFRESLFRAAVECDGVPVADIVQVWLDTSAFPARGAAQADELRSRMLAPLFMEAQ